MKYIPERSGIGEYEGFFLPSRTTIPVVRHMAVQHNFKACRYARHNKEAPAAAREPPDD